MNPARNSEVYQELSAAIGEEATDRLLRALGGTRLNVPAVVPADHPIVDAIGMDAAKLLASEFGRITLHLPKGYNRRQRVIDLYERKLAGSEMTLKQIAIATDYTERHVDNIIADYRREKDDGQLSLFG